MSHTKRNKPLKKLTTKEEKLAEKGKYRHPVQIKSDLTPHFSVANKKEAKKEKHRKQRTESKKEIEENKKDE
jgi:hypothetical protein